MKKDIEKQLENKVRAIFQSQSELQSFGMSESKVVINTVPFLISEGYEFTNEGKISLVEVGISTNTYSLIRELMVHYLINLTHFPQNEVLFVRENFV